MLMNDAKDNITIVDDSGEVIVVISEEEIIIKNGYEILYDVGIDQP